MNKLHSDISNIYLWMIIISLIITPISWQYKLLILTITALIFHLIHTGIVDIKEKLAEVILVQQIYSTPDEELENLRNTLEAQHKKEELKENVYNDYVAVRLYAIYACLFIILAGVMYLSEYPNLKNLLDTFN